MKTIFAVDDSAVILLYIEESLKEKGYSAVSAKNGDKAYEKLKKYNDPIDVFIIDIIMAGMDGLTLIREIRKMDGYKTTPVIVLTSINDNSTVEEAKSAGANCWIPKPFEIEDVITAIEKLG